MITSSLCGIAVGSCYSVIFMILSVCEHSCGPEKTVAAIVLTLSIVQCFAGCSGFWVTSSSSQVITNIKTSVCNFIPREFCNFFSTAWIIQCMFADYSRS